jgi:molybdopterin synthase catalytic subunit
MTLEHYPEMTEKSLKSIVTEARERWDLQNITIIHRIGELKVNDQIVLVVTTSKHRQAAFESCHFIMDYLKTDAPFWKKESTEQKEEWVESRESDDEQKKRWQS